MGHGLASEGLATLVFLLITVMVVAVATKYVRVPYTVALVVAGLVIALSQTRLSINLTPDLILFIFLPALLFESAYNLPFSEVRENLRPITLLAVPGVVLTAVCVAGAIHYAAGVSWQTAFLFGAIMSATDPVSVVAIFKQLGAPRRLSTIIEGESLFNDGTSLVLFRIVLAIVVTGTMSDVTATVMQFLFVVLGALVLGIAVGYGVSRVLTRVNDSLVETAMTLVVAYGTYLLAEEVGVSGVIAVVVAAMVLGNYGRDVGMSPTTRLTVSSTWEFFGFLANSFIFLLIGLELNIGKLMQFWLPALMAIISVLVVRAVVVVVSGWVLRYIHRPLPYRWQTVLVWGGLRGSLALAMALSLPLFLATGESFPNRDLLQVITFGVILFSILVQGLTMQPLLRSLNIVSRTGWQEDFEMLAVRKGMAAAAMAEVERLGRTGGLSAREADELRRAYAERISNLDNELQSLKLKDEDLRREYLRRVRRRLLLIEKNVVRQRNLDGAIAEEPMRAIVAEIDTKLHSLDEGEEDVAIEVKDQASEIKDTSRPGEPRPIAPET